MILLFAASRGKTIQVADFGQIGHPVKKAGEGVARGWI